MTAATLAPEAYIFERDGQWGVTLGLRSQPTVGDIINITTKLSVDDARKFAARLIECAEGAEKYASHERVPA